MAAGITPDLRNKNLLILSTEFPPVHYGGLGTHVLDLVEGVSTQFKRVDIFVPTSGLNYTEVGSRYSSHFCAVVVMRPVWDEIIGDQLMASTCEVLVDAVKAHYVSYRPDLIHCHDVTLFGAAAMLGAFYNSPIVSTCHITLADAFRWGHAPAPSQLESERRAYETSDCVIAVSADVAAVIQRHYVVDPLRIEVIHNSVPGSFNEARLTTGVQSDPSTEPDCRTIVFAGRIAPQKGIIPLLASAEIVLNRGQAVQYVIAGQLDLTGEEGSFATPAAFAGRYHRTITRYVQSSSILSGRVSFIGKLSSVELACLYKRSYLVLVPSAYEPFGYAALEAMSCGTAVVASNTGGLPEIIEDGVSGCLVRIRETRNQMAYCDIRELADTQCKLLGDMFLREELAIAGQHRALTLFEVGSMAGLTLGCYRHTLAWTA